MSKSKIEWTDRTWEPVQGCTPVSSGCIECWAKRLAEGRMKRFYPEGFGKVMLREDKLRDVTPRQKPEMIFVCSRSDLFHPDVPFSLIYRVLMIIKDCSQHTFQILTKRPDRMEIFFRHAKTDGLLFQNLWLGVSVEDQKTADERIPLLLQCQAAVRFVSLEPLLGGILLWGLDEIDGLIIGCESGPGRRTCKLEWVYDIVDQAKNIGVPVFIKQLNVNGKVSHNPEEWPIDLRIRERPEVMR